MAGRVGFLPRGFKHVSTPEEDDTFETDLDTDGEEFLFSEHTAASVHDRYYDEGEDDFAYRPDRSLTRVIVEKKAR